MKDKEKQIEEMAKVIADGRYHNDYISPTKSANLLYDLGYQKLPKDSVVLTKTEKEKLLKEMYEQGKFDAIADLDKDGKVVLSTEELKDMVKARTKCVENAIIRTRKETAEKIFGQIIWYAVKRIGQTSVSSYYQMSFERLNELAKHFGVEIKE